MSSASTIAYLLFHLFMIFFVIYSGFAVFAMIRYGESRTLGLTVAVVYFVVVSGFYTHILTMINQI